MLDYRKLSPDLLAYLNPALAAALLVEYCDEHRSPALMTHALVSTAAVLDPDIRQSMGSTNRTTGFFGWLEKRTDVPALARTRIPAYLRVSQDGLLLALSARLVLLESETATLTLSSSRQEGNPRPHVLRDDEWKIRSTLVRRLAAWTMKLNNPNIFLHTLGLKVT